MVKIIYDGTDCVFGRLASRVAKDLLRGDSVDVLNSEGILVSGDKRGFVEKILAKRRMGRGGSMKGPKYPRSADRLVKRMIRGMLPRDRAKGRDALKRLRCFTAGGEEKGEGSEVVKLGHKRPMRCFTIKEVVGLLK